MFVREPNRGLSLYVPHKKDVFLVVGNPLPTVFYVLYVDLEHVQVRGESLLELEVV